MNAHVSKTADQKHQTLKTILLSLLVLIVVIAVLAGVAFWRIYSPVSIDPPTFYNNMALMGMAQDGYDTKTKSVALTSHTSDYPSGTSTFTVPLDMKNDIHLSAEIRLKSPAKEQAEGVAIALRQVSGSAWKRGDGGGGLGLARMSNVIGFKIDLNHSQHDVKLGYKFSNDPSSVPSSKFFGSWVATGITSKGKISSKVANNYLQGIDTKQSVKLLPHYIGNGQFHVLTFDYYAHERVIQVTFVGKHWKLDTTHLINTNKAYWLLFSGATSSIDSKAQQEYRLQKLVFVPSRN